jgi:hypothetical protein
MPRAAGERNPEGEKGQERCRRVVGVKPNGERGALDRDQRSKVGSRTATVSRIRPGDRGKVRSGWLIRPLTSRVEIHRMRKAEFTSSSGSVRALSVIANKELGNAGRLETASG